MSAPTLIALLHGPDRPGLVAATSSWIASHNGNILHADQHRDASQGIFFQRIEWAPAPDSNPSEVANNFDQFVRNQLQMSVRVTRSDHTPRIAIFTSAIPHCFQDIILRVFTGELRAHIACAISNHESPRAFAQKFDIPFHYIPYTDRTSTEQRQLAILRDARVELILLARYMRILSPEFLAQAAVPIINIHHSFLPAFIGARPYHQAHDRGVKIIGATAHYVTPALDDGPIIAQEVTPVNHRHSVQDFIERGRELEKIVFAKATRLHLESKVLCYGNKTVVFE